MTVNRLPNIDRIQACDVCGRTMLKGEQAEAYLTPSRDRRMVCQLCEPRAQQEGWIREGAAPETPARPQRAQERRGLLRWGRRREPGDDDPRDASAGGPATVTPARGTPAQRAVAPENGTTEDPADNSTANPTGAGEPALRSPFRRRRPGPRSPRHVRAVPTNAQLKIDRALDLFNESEHRRTVAGIVKTLGAPHASATTSAESAAQVLVTVAWELSWYQFVVDLSDGREPVQVRSQGRELEELPADARAWNLETGQDGSLARADGEESVGGGEPGD
jgi:hypothetical protein